MLFPAVFRLYLIRLCLGVSHGPLSHLGHPLEQGDLCLYMQAYLCLAPLCISDGRAAPWACHCMEVNVVACKGQQAQGGVYALSSAPAAPWGLYTEHCKGRNDMAMQEHAEQFLCSALAAFLWLYPPSNFSSQQTFYFHLVIILCLHSLFTFTAELGPDPQNLSDSGPDSRCRKV